MNVIGVLSWYDESPAWLSACVAGFGRVCDTIIAVDGAYELYPKGRARSMPDQREAIMAAAEAVGCACIVYQPKSVWRDNEVGKRNAALDVVRSVGTELEDWVIVFDGDFLMMQAYPDAVREVFEQTEHHVATYTILDGLDPMTDPDRAALAQATDISTEWTVRVRGCFRLLPKLRYEIKHWNVVGELDGEKVTLFGPHTIQVEEEARLEYALVAYHRRQARARVRLQAGETYYQIRDAANAEGGDLVSA